MDWQGRVSEFLEMFGQNLRLGSKQRRPGDLERVLNGEPKFLDEPRKGKSVRGVSAKVIGPRPQPGRLTVVQHTLFNRRCH
jgi:hypothetical protein